MGAACGKYGRVVFEAFGGEHVQCPIAVFANRKARSAVSNRADANRTFDRVIGVAQVIAKLLRRLLVDQAVRVTMARNFMSRIGDPLQKGRVLLGDPAQDKERAAYVRLFEYIE